MRWHGMGYSTPRQRSLEVVDVLLPSIYADNCACNLYIDDVIPFKGNMQYRWQSHGIAL